MKTCKKTITSTLIFFLLFGCTNKTETIKNVKGSLKFLTDLNSILSSGGKSTVPSYNAVGLLSPGAGPGSGPFQKPCASRPGKSHPDQGSGICSGNNYFEVELPTTGVSLSYNSQSSQIQFGFGYGFSLSIDEHFFLNANSNQFYLVQGDGSIISHHKSVEGEWVSDDVRLVRSVFKLNGETLLQLLPEGEKAEFQLVSSGDTKHYVLSRLLDRNSNATTITRNLEGLITKISDPYGSAINISYSNGVASSLQDAAGNFYTFNYDEKKRLISLTQPDGRASTFSYKAHLGWITEKKDANGKKLNYEYYISGDLLSIKNELGYITALYYEPNEVKLKTSFDTEIEKFDSQGRIISYSKNGVQTLYNRNENGLLVSEKDPIGRVTSYTYASTNGLIDPRPASISYPDNGGTTTFIQTGGLRPYPPSKVTHVQGTMKSVTTLDVNHEGVLSEVKGSKGQNVTSYTYDARGNLLSIRKNGLITLSYSYDTQGRVLSATNGAGLTTSYTYSAQGSLSSEADPFGRVANYQHDALGNVVQATTSTVKYSQEYNNLGQRVGMSATSSVSGGGDISVAANRTYSSSGALSTFQLVKKASGQLQSAYEEIYKTIAGQLERRFLKNASGENYNLDQ